MRDDEKRLGRRGRIRECVKRVATAGISAVVAATMAFSAPVAALADAVTTDTGITIDKSAGALDENNQSQVSLSFTGETDKTYSDVVFVLDKSTSTDVSDAAVAMLEELMERAGENKIKVGVVIFNKVASVELELTELNEDNFSIISEALYERSSSGTNIDAGIQAGKAMLDADKDVAASAKHLVLVTDGVTYLYGTGDPQTIYTESISNGEESLNAGNDDISATYMDQLTSSGTWYNTYGSSIADDIAAYGTTYESGSYAAKDYAVNGTGNRGDTDWSNIGFTEDTADTTKKHYVPGEVASEHAGANAAAAYSAMTAWKSVVDAGYDAYAYADDKYVGQYDWGYAFVSTLGDFGGTSGAVPEDTTGMFDSVQSDILYSLGEGSVVEDVMGYGDNYDFDFVNDLDKIDVTFNGEALEKAQTAENEYTFYNAAGETAFVLTYDPDADSFTLNINVPIAGDDVVLSYYVELAQAPTEPGDYTLHTNASATITPEGGDSVTFPDPTIDYTVEEEEPVTPDEPTTTPDDGTDDTKVADDATTSDGKLPKTGDPASIASVAMAAMAGLGAIGAGTLVSKRRK